MKISQELIKCFFSYNPTTGIISNRVGRGGRGARCDALAGTLKLNGYRRVCFKRKEYQGSHLIWIYMTGEFPPLGMDIDHINGCRDDNRWSNLRLATRRQNLQNKRLEKKNKIGLKGVSQHKTPNLKKSWYARIVVNGKKKHLGFFETPLEAHAAYTVAAKEHFGEFARFR